MPADLSVVRQPFKASVSRVKSPTPELHEASLPSRTGYSVWNEEALLHLGITKLKVPGTDHRLTKEQGQGLYGKLTNHRFFPVAQAFRTELENSDLVFLTSPTGSGKTTMIPPYLLVHGHDVVVLVPRRILAETCSGFVSNHFFDQNTGGLVGWRHGFGRMCSDKSQIRFETPGMTLQSIEASMAALKPSSVLIFDEFHEPNPLSHLVFAMALKEQNIRRARGEKPFKIGCMSATIDPQALGQDLLRQYGLPSFATVSAQYADGSTSNPLVKTRVIKPQRIFEDISEALRNGRKILYFSPSISAAQELQSEISARFPKLKVHLLTRRHAQSLEGLEKSAEGEGSLIISTVSRTGITHPGIDLAFDPGVKVEEHASGHLRIPTRVTTPITKKEMIQGHGRLGRIIPEGDFDLESLKQDYVIAALPNKLAEGEKSPFETQQLGELILQLSVATQPGRKNPRVVLPSSQKLPRPPSKETEADWIGYLQALNLVSPQGYLSPEAVKVARLPLDLPAGRLVVMAEERCFSHDKSLLIDACMIASIMTAQGLKDTSVRDPRWLDIVSNDHKSDVLQEHEIFRLALEVPTSDLNRFCRRHDLCVPAVKAARQAFVKLIEMHKIDETEVTKALEGTVNTTALHECLQEALLPYVAWKDGMNWRLSDGKSSRNWKVPRDSLFPATSYSLIVGLPVAFLEEDERGTQEPTSDQYQGTIFHATEITPKRYHQLMSKYQYLRPLHSQVPALNREKKGHEPTTKTDRSFGWH